MLQQLALLAGFDLEAMGPGPDYVHTVIECAKLAFADREAWYGDPDFADVPLAALLSAAYADERRALVGERASEELRPGSPGGREPQLPPLPGGTAAVAAGSGEPTLGLAGDTCHLDVADRHGNLVSATPSGGWLHGSPNVPGLGFCMGTRGQMFWLTEGLPNSLEPGKRPRTTLTPTLVLRDGEPYMSIGTPGGDMQDQWQLGALLGHLCSAATSRRRSTPRASTATTCRARSIPATCTSTRSRSRSARGRRRSTSSGGAAMTSS